MKEYIPLEQYRLIKKRKMSRLNRRKEKYKNEETEKNLETVKADNKRLSKYISVLQERLTCHKIG